jgi:hypothetical protein
MWLLQSDLKIRKPAEVHSDGANLDDGVPAGSPIELGYRRAVAAHFAPSID